MFRPCKSLAVSLPVSYSFAFLFVSSLSWSADEGEWKRWCFLTICTSYPQVRKKISCCLNRILMCGSVHKTHSKSSHSPFPNGQEFVFPSPPSRPVLPTSKEDAFLNKSQKDSLRSLIIKNNYICPVELPQVLPVHCPSKRPQMAEVFITPTNPAPDGSSLSGERRQLVHIHFLLRLSENPILQCS